MVKKIDEAMLSTIFNQNIFTKMVKYLLKFLIDHYYKSSISQMVFVDPERKLAEWFNVYV